VVKLNEEEKKKKKKVGKRKGREEDLDVSRGH